LWKGGPFCGETHLGREEIILGARGAFEKQGGFFEKQRDAAEGGSHPALKGGTFSAVGRNFIYPGEEIYFPPFFYSRRGASFLFIKKKASLHAVPSGGRCPLQKNSIRFFLGREQPSFWGDDPHQRRKTPLLRYKVGASK